MNPSRAKNRTRGYSTLAREPIAFRGAYELNEYGARIDLSVALSENQNRGLSSAATLGFNDRQPSNAARIAQCERPELFPNERVSFPGRDSLGRANPRMARRTHA